MNTKNCFCVFALCLLIVLIHTESAIAQTAGSITDAPHQWFESRKTWSTETSEREYPENTISTVTPTPSLYPNITLHPTSNIHQTEECVSVNPSNASMSLVGANTHNPIALRSFQGYFRSTDNGVNWSGRDTLDDFDPSTYSDPSVAYDLNGNAYFSYIRSQYYSHYLTVRKSTDGGITWGGTQTVPWGTNPDKEHLTVDVSPSSPYKNTYYLGWTDLSNYFANDTSTPNPLWVIRDSAGAF